MKKYTDIQIDKILKASDINLSSFEKSVRPALNSSLSEKIHAVFNIIFEPKTFTVSTILCLLIYYFILFLNIVYSNPTTPKTMFYLIITIYPLVRFIKFIKNKIR